MSSSYLAANAFIHIINPSFNLHILIYIVCYNHTFQHYILIHFIHRLPRFDILPLSQNAIGYLVVGSGLISWGWRLRVLCFNCFLMFWFLFLHFEFRYFCLIYLNTYMNVLDFLVDGLFWGMEVGIGKTEVRRWEPEDGRPKGEVGRCLII